MTAYMKRRALPERRSVATDRQLIALAMLAVMLLLSPVIAQAQRRHGPPSIRPEVHHDLSPPLRSMKPLHEPPGRRPVEQEMPTHNFAPDQTDPVRQTLAAPAAPSTGVNWLGVGRGFSGPQGTYSVNLAPPDTNGAVGANQVVEWVNTSFAVFSKADGTVLYGPVAGKTLWQGFGGNCETNNNGDPIVQYDVAAGR